jgi:threonine synthase
MTYCIFCTSCRHSLSDADHYVYNCPDCGSILDVEYDLDVVRRLWTPTFLAGRRGAMSRWRELLPLRPEDQLISLGEGDTPLIQVPANLVGCDGIHLWLKLEICNPSGSFKDRPIAVAISKAHACGAVGVIGSSSGNAGASLAAYSARLGLPCIVLVPATSASETIARIGAYGARVFRVEGDLSAPFHLAKQAADNFGWINVTTTYLSPYPTEGNKTVGFEIAMQLDWDAPDWILVPVGAGPLLYGCYKAFVEMRSLGLVNHIPRFAAVQAAGCAPIYRAWCSNERQVSAWDTPQTIANGIADPLKGYSQDGTFTLQAVRASKGIVVAVSDEEILAAHIALSRQAGILVEPTSAVPLAGLRHMMADGHVDAGQTVVLLITGRSHQNLDIDLLEVPVIPNDLTTLRRVLDQASRRQASYTRRKGGV